MSNVTRDDLEARSHQLFKPREEWRIGAAFGKFAVERDTGNPLAAEVLDRILAGLVENFGWQGRREEGRITLLRRGPSAITLGPGGQVEFSTDRAASVDEIGIELARHLEELEPLAPRDRVAWLAAGVSPLAEYREAPLAEYATAETRVGLDCADEADAARKFTTAATLSPLVNALWANGPLYAGKPTGMASSRGQLWRELSRDVVFPEVRLTTSALEIRGADAVPYGLALSVPAFWKGLLYDTASLDAAAEVAGGIPAADLPGVQEASCKRGLNAEYGGRKLSAWCAELVALAAEGLRRLSLESGDGWDEAVFLDPVHVVLERGRSPGSEFLAWEKCLTATPAEVAGWFEVN